MNRAAIVAAAALLALAGCSKPAPDPAQAAAVAARALPADARLARLYTQSCRTCHAVPATGAPLTGDVAAWAPRLEQGQEALLASVIAGKNAMPAGGQCFACTPDDLRALITFMSSPQ